MNMGYEFHLSCSTSSRFEKPYPCPTSDLHPILPFTTPTTAAPAAAATLLNPNLHE